MFLKGPVLEVITLVSDREMQKRPTSEMEERVKQTAQATPAPPADQSEADSGLGNSTPLGQRWPAPDSGRFYRLEGPEGRLDTPRPDSQQQTDETADGEGEGERVTAWQRTARGGRHRQLTTRREDSSLEDRVYYSEGTDETEDRRSSTPETRPPSLQSLENRLHRQENSLSLLQVSMDSIMLTLRSHMNPAVLVQQESTTRATGVAPTTLPSTTATNNPPAPTPPSPSVDPSKPASPPPTQPGTTPSTGHRSAVPPKVKGYDGISDIETYISQVEAVARGNGWSNADTARHVVAALEGDGREVIGDVEPTELDNFEKVVAALRRRFGRFAIQENARTQLKTRERGKGESVGKYAAVLIALTRRGWPDATDAHREDILLRAFTDGLHPPRLREHVLLRRCKTMAAALEEANEADTVMSTSSPTPRVTTLPPPRNAATPSPRTTTPRRPRARAAALEEDSAEEEEECHEVAPMSCQRCLRIGHRPQECDAALPHHKSPCARCERIGHSAVDCRTPWSQLPQKKPSLPLNDQGKMK